MKNIKSILRKKKILFFFLFLLCVFFCFFKIKQYFICFDLDKCPVNDITVPYRQFLDSLDLFVIKGGEGNASDYFLYDGFRIYCVSLNSSICFCSKTSVFVFWRTKSIVITEKATTNKAIMVIYNTVLIVLSSCCL